MKLPCINNATLKQKYIDHNYYQKFTFSEKGSITGLKRDLFSNKRKIFLMKNTFKRPHAVEENYLSPLHIPNNTGSGGHQTTQMMTEGHKYQ